VLSYDNTSGIANKYVTQYTPADELLSEAGPGTERATAGVLAVNPSNGVLYVTENADFRISIFTPATVPAVVTEPLAEPDVHGEHGKVAKLTGKVNTEGAEGHYYFEYGTTNAYTLGKTPEATITTAEAAAHPSGLNVTTTVTTTAGTTYHYRLVACLGAAPCTAVSAFNYGADKTIAPRAAEGPEGVEAKPATTIQAVTATLNGSVEPNGEATEYHFKYGTCTSLAACPKATYPSTTGELSAGSTAGPVSTPAAITGLTPATIYHYKLIAKNKAGTTTESLNEVIFIAKPAVTAVKTLAPSSVTPTSAIMNASLEPESSAVEYFLEYGTSASYGQSTSVKTSSSGSEVAVSEPWTGLTPLTVYHYRIVAKRVLEGKPFTVDGADQSFITAGIAPEIQSEGTSAVTPFSATLEATINPGNSATSYWFVYGTSPTGEQAVLPAAVASGYGSIQVIPRVLEALQPDTTYYYHVVAENPFGKVEGVEGPGGPEEKTFTTLPASAPEASVGQVGEVGSTSASVPVTVNPNGLATEYEIQIATSGVYTPVTVLSAGEEAVSKTSAYGLSGLAPGTTYELRVVAWNAAGETTSSAGSFTTAASLAAVFVRPLTPVLIAFTPAVTPAGEVVSVPTTKTKSLTNAQKLAKALKACKKKTKSKRTSCEKQARKKYAPAKAKKKKKR